MIEEELAARLLRSRRTRKAILIGGLVALSGMLFQMLLAFVIFIAIVRYLFGPELWVASEIGQLVNGVGEAASWFSCVVSGCSASGSNVQSMPQTLNESAVQAVTETWLPYEQAAVSYYCSRAHGQPCVTVPFVQAIMMQESGGNPGAISPDGALGLMQLLPSHFSAGQEWYDPKTNIMVGVSFLDQLDAIFNGNLPLVAAGYNAGPGAPEAWIAQFHTSNWAVLSTMPEVQAWGQGQTWNYVQDVMAYYARFSQMAASVPTPPTSAPVSTQIHG